MDIVASPTSTEAEEASARRFPPIIARRPVGGRPQSHADYPAAPDQPSTFTKPPVVKHLSTPEYSSPLRHHRRSPSAPKYVKESLNARSEYVTSHDDGVAEHRINQYVIKQEIGRGSFGAVHLAVDQFGTEYAVKEFSKARLRKRAQSHILRKPLNQRRRGALQGFNSPLHRTTPEEQSQKINSIDLIKEEIAIMKKLNHPNLVSLIEVLDDPTEDSLYMVMEMCKKGVVMRVGLEERADPYPDHVCRYWFRDLILGIEYLHAQGVVHRDIKPDNCLVTDDDVLKVVDFGVSEMFSKDSEMQTAKSAGSPAFLPPELCVARHGDVSGRAADIWSMGVTLYCLKYGKIPFEKTGIFELYEAIKSDIPDLESENDQDFRDLMTRLLEKDPAQRIKMPELRNHPWVTQRGADKLLSEEENTSDLVEPPTAIEMNAAITNNIGNLMTVMKAVNKFKGLLDKNKPPPLKSILGEGADAHFSHPPASIPPQDHISLPPKSHSFTFGAGDAQVDGGKENLRRDLQKLHIQPVPTLSIDDTTIAGPARSATFNSETSTDSDDAMSKLRNVADTDLLDPSKLPPFRSNQRHAVTVDEIGNRGHARDPLEEQLFLYIGPSTFSGTSSNTEYDNGFMPDDDSGPIVSESPGAADMDIYETAYRDEIERIMARAKEQNKEPNVYLTRRVDAKLMSISGLAGKWAAMGEEAKNQFKDYTQFSTRKARVTEVSRALRQAAREEYEKRKQERREWIATEKIRRAEGQDPAKAAPSPRPSLSEVDSGNSLPLSPGARSPSVWKGKAVDKGRQAKTSIRGLVDTLKSRTRSKDEEG
ncbi:hypothetical protein LTR84_012467 [Exophiala bonariae]|uniref:Protein kinase domain-containing protein n=1 Tax=Exophiala bonariae TaxID=1690606 RepID=A0AAV9NHP8_9EURO|nr:hypothetical protein LTR84_012467 [Exophiala bonariae]